MFAPRLSPAQRQVLALLRTSGVQPGDTVDFRQECSLRTLDVLVRAGYLRPVDGWRRYEVLRLLPPEA